MDDDGAPRTRWVKRAQPASGVSPEFTTDGPTDRRVRPGSRPAPSPNAGRLTPPPAPVAPPMQARARRAPEPEPDPDPSTDGAGTDLFDLHREPMGPQATPQAAAERTRMLEGRPAPPSRAPVTTPRGQVVLPRPAPLPSSETGWVRSPGSGLTRVPRESLVRSDRPSRDSDRSDRVLQVVAIGAGVGALGLTGAGVAMGLALVALAVAWPSLAPPASPAAATASLPPTRVVAAARAPEPQLPRSGPPSLSAVLEPGAPKVAVASAPSLPLPNGASWAERFDGAVSWALASVEAAGELFEPDEGLVASASSPSLAGLLGTEAPESASAPPPASASLEAAKPPAPTRIASNRVASNGVASNGVASTRLPSTRSTSPERAPTAPRSEAARAPAKPAPIPVPTPVPTRTARAAPEVALGDDDLVDALVRSAPVPAAPAAAAAAPVARASLEWSEEEEDGLDLVVGESRDVKELFYDPSDDLGSSDDEGGGLERLDTVLLMIEVDSPGAGVEVDGVRVGTAPLAHAVEPGAHQLKLWSGGRATSFTVDAASDPSEWCFELRGDAFKPTRCE